MNTKIYSKSWPAFLPYKLVYPDIPLFKIVETAANYYPEKKAINYYGMEINYRTLQKKINTLAGQLKKMGIGKGKRVAICMQNTPHFVISFFGVLRANAVVVLISPALQSEELLYLINDSKPDVLITTLDLLGKFNKVKNQINLKTIIVGKYADYLLDRPLLKVPENIKTENEDVTNDGSIRIWSELLEEEMEPPKVEVNADDLCTFIYTAGSTGTPKACMHSHKTIMANLYGCGYLWKRETSSSVHLSVIPMFHVTGLVQDMLVTLYAGGTLVILTRWDRDTALQAIEKFKCTHWVNVPTMIFDILNAANINEYDLSSLLLINGGGTSMPEEVAQKLKDITGIEYNEGYGLTETASAVTTNPLDRPKHGSVGIPLFNVDIRIIDIDSGKEVPLGEKGELVVNAPQVFKGYLNKPEETRNSFIELEGKQFFCTGDICYMDEEGYVFLVDRSKRMINASGFKIWPAEVEATLYKNEHVSEACVVGVKDPKRGENVRAYIVLKPESVNKVQPEDIVAWCKERMATYKYPRQIVFVDSLPKSGAGKILWREMQARANQDLIS